MAKFEAICKYKITAQCKSPLRIGGNAQSKDDVLVDEFTGLPFIQASSIAGAMGEYIEKNKGKKIRTEIFEGNLRVSDAKFFEEDVLLENRPRLSLNKFSGTVASSKLKGTEGYSGNKFDQRYIASMSKFEFEIILYTGQNSTKSEHQFIIEEVFSAFEKEYIKLGSQKTNGCGKISILKVEKNKYSMNETFDRNAWAKDLACNFEILDVSNVKLIDNLKMPYRFKLIAEIDKALLLKGSDGAEQFKDANERYIIPGSSIKGAFRNHIEKISSFKNLNQEFITSMFGSSSQDDEVISGKIIFDEIVIKESKDIEGFRIKIDKFTGGVIDMALVSERPIWGKIAISAEVAKDNEEEGFAKNMMLLWAFRDISKGMFSLGGGESIGRGYIKPQSLSVSDGDEEILKIDFTEKTPKFIKGEGLIKKWGNSLDQKVQGGL